MKEKIIFDLSPIEKKLVWPYQALHCHFGFWLKRGSTAQKFCWRTIFFNQYHVLDHLKQKMAAMGGGAGKPHCGVPLKGKWHINFGRKFRYNVFFFHVKFSFLVIYHLVVRSYFSGGRFSGHPPPKKWVFSKTPSPTQGFRVSPLWKFDWKKWNFTLKNPFIGVFNLHFSQNFGCPLLPKTHPPPLPIFGAPYSENPTIPPGGWGI